MPSPDFVLLVAGQDRRHRIALKFWKAEKRVEKFNTGHLSPAWPNNTYYVFGKLWRSVRWALSKLVA
jgi:hypothetical protein